MFPLVCTTVRTREETIKGLNRKLDPKLSLRLVVEFSSAVSRDAAHIGRLSFPKVRVWGTIGWIVAGLAVGILGWSAKFNMFYLNVFKCKLLFT